MKVVASGKGMPVVVLNRNEPALYCVPAGAYEAMMELIEDLELLDLVKQREHEESVRVSVGTRDRNEVYEVALSRLRDPG